MGSTLEDRGMPGTEAVAELAPGGMLRAGINLGNPLLVTGRSASGDPTGVAPDMAAAIAGRLGVTCRLVGYATPAEVARAVGEGECDIGLIGADPARADKVAFTAAYTEIEATYLVGEASPFQTVEAVDQPGVRVGAKPGAAFTLWLERGLQRAELVPVAGAAEALEDLLSGKLDALANLRPTLGADAAARPGLRVLPGRFMTVQQAVGTPRSHKAALPFLSAFVAEAVGAGLVAQLIERHRVEGLSVARGA